MRIESLKGVSDILPQEMLRWNVLEEQARHLFVLYGFQEIRVPFIEDANLFIRSIGEATDIVEKEMYVFQDKGRRSIALRPEATASVVRAYLEHHFDRQGLAKFFYHGAMFRGEKPQAGRNRQFYQIGVEALGSYDPYLDVETIGLAMEYLRGLGLKDYFLAVNSVGCGHDKSAYGLELKKYLRPREELLCDNCRRRIQKNILRVLDCKQKTCLEIIAAAPPYSRSLCEPCREHFARVTSGLEKIGINYAVQPHLVRGLDYYTRTVFEITHARLGAQNTIAAGGRYDDLIGELGGKAAGAAGFALGTERLLLALEQEKIEFARPVPEAVFVIGIGREAYETAFAITARLRNKQIQTYIDYEQRSLKAQMRQADKLRCRFALLLGGDELKKNQILLRDMQNSRQELLNLDTIIFEVHRRLKERAHE